MSTICLHTALLFRLAWCVCVREREKERLHGCTSTRSVHEHAHLCVFAYTHRPLSGSLPDTSAHCLADCQGRTTQKLRSNAQKTANQPVTRHLQLRRKKKQKKQSFVCLTSEKVESLKAQRRSALAQCLVSYHTQRLMFD